MQINRQSYEEYFLLYADGELNESEKKAVEEFIDQNPDLAGELSLIQETVFTPDGTIIFENKELLFKEESAERKVIYMRWFRIAAAAVVLIALSIVAWLFAGDEQIHNQPVAVVKQPEVKKTQPAEIIASDEETKQPEQLQKTIQKSTSRTEIALTAQVEKKENKAEEEIVSQPREEDVLDVVPPAKIIEGAAFNQDVRPANETIDVAVEPRAMNNNNGNEQPKDVSYAQSFKQEPDDDMIYFANTSLTKKTKLRGVLRKATRYLDRVTSLQ